MTMIGPFHPWRDTLQDLGVMGLVPVPVQGETVTENPPQSIFTQLSKEVDQEKNRNVNSAANSADPVACPTSGTGGRRRILVRT